MWAVLSLQNGPDSCRLRQMDTVRDVVGWGHHEFAEYVDVAGAPDPPSGHIARWPDGADTDDNSADWREVELATTRLLQLARPAGLPYLSCGPRPRRRCRKPIAVTTSTSAYKTWAPTCSTVRVSKYEPGGMCGRAHPSIPALPSGASRDMVLSLPPLVGGVDSLVVVPFGDRLTIGGAGASLALSLHPSPVLIHEVYAAPAPRGAGVD